MSFDITLYEYPPTRSARCRWTLLEAGLDFKSISDSSLFHSEELRKVHPLGKLPAIVINGQALFESSAICTHIADLVPEHKLIAPVGSWARALHDQWTCFCMTELEAYLWSTFINTTILPAEKRVPKIAKQNAEAFCAGAAVLNEALNGSDYLIQNRFSVTDIIIGYTVNWGGKRGLIESFSNLQRYLDRLYRRPHCTLIP